MRDVGGAWRGSLGAGKTGLDGDAGKAGMLRKAARARQGRKKQEDISLAFAETPLSRGVCGQSLLKFLASEIRPEHISYP